MLLPSSVRPRLPPPQPLQLLSLPSQQAPIQSFPQPSMPLTVNPLDGPSTARMVSQSTSAGRNFAFSGPVSSSTSSLSRQTLMQPGSRLPIAISASSSQPSTTFDSTPRRRLRRKPCLPVKEAGRSSAARVSTDNTPSTGFNRALSRSRTQPDDCGFYITNPQLTASLVEDRNLTQKLEMPLVYPELDRYRHVEPGVQLLSTAAMSDLTLPMSSFSARTGSMSAFGGTSSPSTLFSASPEPGPYSRDTTPATVSPQSPALVASVSNIPPFSRLPRRSVSARQDILIGTSPGRIKIGPKRAYASPDMSISSSANLTSNKPSPHCPKPQFIIDAVSQPKVQSAPLPMLPHRASSRRLHESLSQSARLSLIIQPTSQKLPDTTHSQIGTSEAPLERGDSDITEKTLILRSLSSSGFSLVFPRSESPSRALTSGSRHPKPRPPLLAATRHKAAASSPTLTTLPRAPGLKGFAFKTRFPLFGRRPGPVVDDAEKEQTPRNKDESLSMRKGPAAGTGYEGYGRLGQVGRRHRGGSSSLSRAARSASSQDSLTGLQYIDPYLMERTAPVVIAGGEVIENGNHSSDLSLVDSNSSYQSSYPVCSSREDARHTLWPSPFPCRSPSLPAHSPPHLSYSTAHSVTSDGDVSETSKPSALSRGQPLWRSVSAASSPSLNHFHLDSTRSGRSSTDPQHKLLSQKKADFNPPHKLIKRRKSLRRENLTGQPAHLACVPESFTGSGSLEVVQAKSAAFYTMLDYSEQENSNPSRFGNPLALPVQLAADLPGAGNQDQLLRSRPSSLAPSSLPIIGQEADSHKLSGTDLDVIPLPTKTTLRDSSPNQLIQRRMRTPTSQHSVKVLGHHDADTTTPGLLVCGAPSPTDSLKPHPRPARLQQIGRIPKVIRSRPAVPKPNSSNTTNQSRWKENNPLSQTPRSAPHPPTAASQMAFMCGVRCLPHPTSRDISIPSDHLFQLPSPLGDSSLAKTDYLSLATRYDAPLDAAAQCPSDPSVLAYADATAIIPKPDDPLHEDEVWHEFDDLTLPIFKPVDARSHSKPRKSALSRPDLVAPSPHLPPSCPLPPPPFPLASRHVKSQLLKITNLNRSNQASTPAPIRSHSKLMSSPKTKMTSTRTQPTTSLSKIQKPQTTSSHDEQNELMPATINFKTCRANTSCSLHGSSSSPITQVNLRIGSMTVSKWLTFGNLLFSPAKDMLEPKPDSLTSPSILVIDGLGNDDWSFYAAETLPGVNFFNLSPRPPLTPDLTHASSMPHAPPNHHQVQYHSYADRFPFGSESFTAVVFRFPIVAPESDYRNILAEARRVLQSGGYIELSILDVDLKNMGPRCRKMVRLLKERIQSQSPRTALGPISDLALRVLGQQAFSNIKTCRVGVPVAAARPRSLKGSTSESLHAMDDGCSMLDERSLPDIMKDDSLVVHEKMTRMVSEVGRWWYSQCYGGVNRLVGRKKSMWDEPALLSECNEWGTSLKLLVCHAQKPDGSVSRVASI